MEALLDDFARMSISSRGGDVRKPKPRKLCSRRRVSSGLLHLCLLPLLYFSHTGQTASSLADVSEPGLRIEQNVPAANSWLAAHPQMQLDSVTNLHQVGSALADPLQAYPASLDSTEAAARKKLVQRKVFLLHLCS